MNNPMIPVIRAMQRGVNPQMMLNQMLRSDPQMAQAMKMVQGKSPAQLRQMVENMCAERGTTAEEYARSLGIAIPSNR